MTGLEDLTAKTEESVRALWPRDDAGELERYATMQEAATAIGVTREYLRKQHQAGRIQGAGRNAKGWVLLELPVVLGFAVKRAIRNSNRAVVGNEGA